MKLISEYDIIQNPLIGALALHKFTCSYYEVNQNLKGPPLSLAMPLLPLVYNKDVLQALFKRRKEAGLSNALAEFRHLPAGLQERMQSMSEQTFQALNIAFASKLITYDNDKNEIIPIEKKVKIGQYNSDIKHIVQAADRIGYWFATLSVEQLCIFLKINL